MTWQRLAAAMEWEHPEWYDRTNDGRVVHMLRVAIGFLRGLRIEWCPYCDQQGRVRHVGRVCPHEARLESIILGHPDGVRWFVDRRRSSLARVTQGD